MFPEFSNPSIIFTKKEIESLSEEIKESSNDEGKIREITSKINTMLSNPEEVKNLKENIYAASIQSGMNDVTKAVTALGGTLVASPLKEAQACGEEILNMVPTRRQGIPFDSYYEILSYLPPKEVRLLLTNVSHSEREHALKVLVMRINNKKILLNDLNFFRLEDAAKFFGESSKMINYLNLKSFNISDVDCEIIKASFPNVKNLLIESDKITNGGLLPLKGLLLQSLSFNWCPLLTDAALLHLKGMPLQNLNFSHCKLLTDAALMHLKGMPLQSLNFSWCQLLTDAALMHLKDMPLQSLDFSGCELLTDAALMHLKGMPFLSLDFNGCKLLTDAALIRLFYRVLESFFHKGRMKNIRKFSLKLATFLIGSN